EPALPMTALRPGIGIEQIDARERAGRHPGDKVARVAEMQADIAEVLRLDQRQRLRHAVDERLAADEAHARPGGRFRHEVLAPAGGVLAPAEADLEADLVGGMGKQRGEPIRRRGAKIEREPRQQALHQRGLARPQRMALAPAEEGTAASYFAALAC